MNTAITSNPNANLTGLRAFHGDAGRQTRMIARVRLHQEQDEIQQGATGPVKGCTIWCSLDKYDHGLLAREMQIPCSLVYANENVFEGANVSFANKWPLRFVSAPKLGADLSLVPHQLYVWLMAGTDSPYLEIIKKEETLELMREGAALVQKYIDGEVTESNQWSSLSERARAASARAENEYWSDLSDLSDLRDLRDLRALRDLRDLSDLSAQNQKFVALAGDKLLTLMAEAPVITE